MVPDLAAAVGVKGRRPTASTRDCEGPLYAVAVVNRVSAAVHGNMLESAKGVKQQTGQSKARLLQEAFADHLRRVGRV
jgi:hypothetical protein